MWGTDRLAGHELLKTGAAADFEVLHTEILEGADPGEFSVRITLNFPVNEATDETDLDWAAFGFLFVVATLSFNDARSRGVSDRDYIEGDEFQVGDLLGGLTWVAGELRFDADYLRGRRIKTRVVLRADGSGTLTTLGRGKAALRWLDRLKGKPLMQLAGDDSGEAP